MNEVMQTLLSHRSIRSYKNKPVEDVQLEQIIKAVQSAPSWINGQQVSIIAVKDPERKKKFAELCGGQKHIEEAPVFLVFCSDFYRAYVSSKIEKTPFAVSENIDTLLVGATDVGIALEAAITASESLGLGTVCIGGIRRNLDKVIKELNLPPFVLPISGLCIGYPADDPGLKPRLPVKAVYHNETYQHDIKDEIESYNQTFSDYLSERSQGTQTGTWTKAVSSFYSKTYYQGVDEAINQQMQINHNKKDIKEKGREA